MPAITCSFRRYIPRQDRRIGRVGDCAAVARSRTVRPRGSPRLPAPLPHGLPRCGAFMEEVTRVVLALEPPDVAEEVMHFLDRSGRARVVGTAGDIVQLTAAVRQIGP